jgi:hypothetical protein
MKLSLLFIPVGLLCLAGPVTGQQVHAGIMGGVAHAMDQPSLDRSIGGDGWIGVEFPALPILPRAIVSYDRFAGTSAGSKLTLKSARIDVLGILRDVPFEPYGFAGVGLASTTYTSALSESPIGVADRAAMFSGGIGAGLPIGGLRLSAEARYITVSDADLQAVQLRLGIGF